MSSSLARSEPAALELEAARLQQVGVVGDAQRRQRVLLDDEHRRALLADGLDGVEDQVDEHRRQAHRRLVEQQQLGRPISARPTASICCSPPDRVPAFCAMRSRSRGNSSSTRSRSPGDLLRGPCAGRRRGRGSPSTVIRGKIRRPSGEWQMPAATISWPGSPMMSLPLNVTEPLRARSRPEIVRRVVDLPAPFEPIRVTISPGADRQGEALHRGDVAVVDVQVLRRSSMAPVARASGVVAGADVGASQVAPVALGARLAEVRLDHPLVVADVVWARPRRSSRRGRAR